jgi:hypothetical protein
MTFNISANKQLLICINPPAANTFYQTHLPAPQKLFQIISDMTPDPPNPDPALPTTTAALKLSARPFHPKTQTT